MASEHSRQYDLLETLILLGIMLALLVGAALVDGCGSAPESLPEAAVTACADASAPDAPDAPEPPTWREANRTLARAWCDFEERCEQSGFRAYFGLGGDSLCVEYTADYYCVVHELAVECAARVSGPELGALQECLSESSTGSCFDGWPAVCHRAEPPQ